jgi:hypothetical protein
VGRKAGKGVSRGCEVLSAAGAKMMAPPGVQVAREREPYRR